MLLKCKSILVFNILCDCLSMRCNALLDIEHIYGASCNGGFNLGFHCSSLFRELLAYIFASDSDEHVCLCKSGSCDGVQFQNCCHILSKQKMKRQ